MRTKMPNKLRDAIAESALRRQYRDALVNIADELQMIAGWIREYADGNESAPMQSGIEYLAQRYGQVIRKVEASNE